MNTVHSGFTPWISIGTTPDANARTEIDLYTERMSMVQLMERIHGLIAENPDRNYWMDGDTFSILSAPRVRL